MAITVTDRTNYHLLSIVGIVAITAIVAMYVHANHLPSQSVSPTVQLIDGIAPSAAGGITGNVIADEKAPPAPTYLRPGIDWNAYDYDGSGTLDRADVDILASVTNRARFCPAGKVCDVNGDGIVDMQDIGVLNAKLLEHAMQEQASHSLLTGNVVGDTFVPGSLDTSSDASYGPDFWSATAGVAVE